MSGYKNSVSERNPSGTIIIDGQDVANTMQCCHCGKHFISVRGSGKIRGFCTCCMQITCGATECNPCIPFERKVDEYEKGKRLVL